MLQTFSLLLALTNPAAAELSDLSGTWTCSYKGPGGSRSVSATAVRLNEDWVELNHGTGGDALVTYDAKRKQWVQFRPRAQGDYALLVAPDAPNAPVLHWKMVYPSQMPIGTTSIERRSASTRIVRSSFTHGGTLISTTATCTKH